MKKFTKIIGANENNLNNIDLEIPIGKITSIIGASGSGKSSLIHGIISSEAKRREKIVNGVAKCKDYATRAKFTSIENLQYCVILNQREIKGSSSSTVATITGLHELLRNEFSKYGIIKCICGLNVIKPNAQSIINFLKKKLFENRIEIDIVVSDKTYTDGQEEINLLKSYKIEEIDYISSIDNKKYVKKVQKLKKFNKSYQSTIIIHLGFIEDIENVVNKYWDLAKHSFIAIINDEKIHFKSDYFCDNCLNVYCSPIEGLFSFNSSINISRGMCSFCNGKGQIKELDMVKLIKANIPLSQPFLNLEHTGKNYKYVYLYDEDIRFFLETKKIPLNISYNDLELDKKLEIKNYLHLKLIEKKHISISKYIISSKCEHCSGSRLNYKANSVKLYDKSISELLSFSIYDLYLFFMQNVPSKKYILNILQVLCQANISYLTLDRNTSTLSIGELQRIKLAEAFMKNDNNIIYILDEPSLGLHAHDIEKIINFFYILKERGNTILLSEHNQMIINASDYIIELGPEGGTHGGNIIYNGISKNYIKNTIYRKKKHKKTFLNYINLYEISYLNIKKQNLSIPKNLLVSIIGVSGSGKSTLINKIFTPTIKQYLFDQSKNYKINGLDDIKGIINLDQHSIGINSRSIIASYIDILDEIRKLFSQTDDAKIYGLNISHFSFNNIEGQCEYCLGLGEKDEFLCPSCLGNRFVEYILEIKYNNLSIVDVLNLSIKDALNFFDKNLKIKNGLNILSRVGLDYLTLIRSTNSLSGGENQRLKLAKILNETKNQIDQGCHIFVFDEPTIGLSIKDSNKLIEIFDELINKGNSVIIIEHNLEMIKNSDYIIEIGPEAGTTGGKIIFQGTYDELLISNESITAKFLKNDILKNDIKLINDSNKNNFKTIPFLSIENSYINNLCNCQEIYKKDIAYDLEKKISSNYVIKNDDNNFFFFKSKESMLNYLNTKNIIYIFFNPFVFELSIYPILSISEKKKKIIKLLNLGFNFAYCNGKKLSIKRHMKELLLSNPWDIKIFSESIDNAFLYGHGWLTIEMYDKTIETSIRAISRTKRIIGSTHISSNTFNRYKNPCKECLGEGLMISINNNIIINSQKRIFEYGFLNDQVENKMKYLMKNEILPALKKLEEEGLHNFINVNLNELDNFDKNIFFHGLIHKKFYKKNKRTNEIISYSWKGLYYYIRIIISKIDHSDFRKILQDNIKYEECPFCKGCGFNQELSLFYYMDQSVLNFLI